MKSRHLSVPITITATKTRCGECRFQHSEVNICTLFGGDLEMKPAKGVNLPGEYGNKRLKECVIAEWRAQHQGDPPKASPTSTPTAP